METNERGNSIERSFNPSDRYKYDFGKCREWTQYDTDQDAWYFGVWVNQRTREILTYAEGDETLVKCPTAESFIAELASMAEFYGPPPPAFTTINFTDNTITKHYDKRPV